VVKLTILIEAIIVEDTVFILIEGTNRFNECGDRAVLKSFFTILEVITPRDLNGNFALFELAVACVSCVRVITLSHQATGIHKVF
jgi:hypothetical protein